MTDISNLCMECLGTRNEAGICPNCGKENDIVQNFPLLPIKSIIAQRYLIAKAHKINGECITYGAYDMKLERAVSIKEFFPEKTAVRDIDLISVTVKPGAEKAYEQHLNSFISLWKKIMRLKGVRALITVNDVFQCGGTAYAVYDESERVTLRDYLLDTKEGFIGWEQARILFMPVLSTLGTLHTSGVIHKGINPAAFIFSADKRLKLTDFATEHLRTEGGFTEAEIFDGYAPLEQYSVPARTDAKTDIYSFCCVLYRALIGSTPIDARERAENDRMMIPARFAEQLPAYVINALINGMAIYPEDRTDNIEQLRSDLSASQRAIGASAPTYAPAVTSETKPVPSLVNEPSQMSKKTAAAQTDKKVQAVLQEKKTEAKKKNRQIAALCTILAVLICCIAVLTAKLVEMKNPSGNEATTSSSSFVTVPNFVGGYIADIISNPEYTDYFIFNTVKENSATVMAGIVLDQSIPFNSTASKGDTIILTISAGPKTLTLPDVTGYTYEEAEAILLNAGLVCKKSLIHNDGTHPGNTVAETIPAKGELVTEGKEITIVLYTSLDEPASVDDQQNSSGNAVEEFLENLIQSPIQ